MLAGALISMFHVLASSKRPYLNPASPETPILSFLTQATKTVRGRRCAIMLTGILITFLFEDH